MKNKSKKIKNHRFRELVQRVPKDREDVIREFIQGGGISQHKVNDWYSLKSLNCFRKMTNEDAWVVLAFFQKYFPELELTDVIPPPVLDQKTIQKKTHASA